MVGVEFHVHRCDILLFYHLVQVVGIEVHDDVEELLFSLVGEETVLHFEYVRMTEHL